MNRRLPSLNAMRAFEAAARHLSFTKAAEELNVTQAAISHQVKALEDQIGILLFQRRNRQLILTDAGQTLLPDLIDAFDAMDAAVTRVKRRDQSGILTVATMDSLAATWLMPRLARFREDNPDIDIRLATSDISVDYERNGIDIGIRYGRGNWPGLIAEELMREDIFPVCAPELIEKGPGLKKPADLRHFPLIHDDMTEDWAMWLKAAGLTDIDPQRGTGFTHSNLVIQAAINGEGVALGRGLLVADSIAAGKLVAPFDLLLTAEYRYFVASTESNHDRPKVKVFRDWLFREARKTADRLTAEKRAWEKKA
ncbi:MAG: transcriptional regulator GcvA [Rhodospirillales bacterium]|nr:transcriptional regulator GcvA [Rhodospirillales bacterium]MBO6787827.1 transcriptional regulator GcvA [Rhodospirillales bacterium]